MDDKGLADKGPAFHVAEPVETLCDKLAQQWRWTKLKLDHQQMNTPKNPMLSHALVVPGDWHEPREKLLSTQERQVPYVLEHYSKHDSPTVYR